MFKSSKHAGKHSIRLQNKKTSATSGAATQQRLITVCMLSDIYVRIYIYMYIYYMCVCMYSCMQSVLLAIKRIVRPNQAVLLPPICPHSDLVQAITGSDGLCCVFPLLLFADGHCAEG